MLNKTCRQKSLGKNSKFVCSKKPPGAEMIRHSFLQKLEKKQPQAYRFRISVEVGTTNSDKGGFSCIFKI